MGAAYSHAPNVVTASAAILPVQRATAVAIGFTLVHFYNKCFILYHLVLLKESSNPQKAYPFDLPANR